MIQRCIQRGAGVRALLALTVALVGALCLGATALYAGAIIEGDNSRITDATLGGGLANRVRIAEHEGTLYAVWEDGRDPAFRTVYFARSTDSGASWGPNIRVGQLMDDWINYPDIAVQPDGTIWIVWHLFWGDTLTGPNDIRLAISTDGGASFQVENLVNGVDGARDFWRNRIVADQSNGDVYVMSHYYNGD